MSNTNREWRPYNDRFTRKPTHRVMQVFACDLLYGRDGAAEMLGISYTTVRNASKHVRSFYGVASNVQAAISLGWMNIPTEFLKTA